MKLAFLIGLSADKRTAFPLSAEAIPFDSALKQFKEMNAARQAPAPHVQLWTDRGLVKSARFEKVVSVESSAALVPDDVKEMKKPDLIKALSAALQQIDLLQKSLDDARDQRSSSAMQPHLEEEANAKTPDETDEVSGDLIPAPK